MKEDDCNVRGSIKGERVEVPFLVNGPVQSPKAIVVDWSERVEITADRASGGGIAAPEEVEQQDCEGEN